MSSLKGPLIRLILTVAHMAFSGKVDNAIARV